ncbi:hypothetical protein CCAX7_64330 [Capsulimonas corticalis]|uniref:Uncharacterized protein n=1 Tax=Capsulimonas corticalis TaxID=2219043 RepID=A0A402CQT5_9BACT|nr:hypothetical protein [Capsulimonas corticalis]BDI34382.1 hypothetical protein CCAX7_64330 [Capsulimonas corticalis]
MIDIAQYLVLGFTAILWWLARRDLTARASRLRASSSAEVDRLRETVEALTTALEERVTNEEKRLSALIAEARSLQSPLTASDGAVPAEHPVAEVLAAPPIMEIPAAQPVAVTPVADPAAQASAAPEIVEEPAPTPAPVAAAAVIEPLVETVAVTDAPVEAASTDTKAASAPEPETPSEPPSPLHQQILESERRAALVRAQLAIGLTDAIEIARRTGLPRGEVELLIGLRALRIEPNTPLSVSLNAADTAVKAPPAASAPEPSASEPEKPEPEEDDRYAAIYAMLASGVTSSTEIARRTGMGRGEVELILGLRARNVL